MKKLSNLLPKALIKGDDILGTKRVIEKMTKTMPEELLDVEGYPTQEYLDFIKNYTYDTCSVMEFVYTIKDGWNYSDWGFVMHRKYKGKIKLDLHTGGWSGNEEIIREVISNMYLTHFKMKYMMWKTGGHYYFEIICEK